MCGTVGGTDGDAVLDRSADNELDYTSSTCKGASKTITTREGRVVDFMHLASHFVEFLTCFAVEGIGETVASGRGEEALLEV